MLHLMPSPEALATGLDLTPPAFTHRPDCPDWSRLFVVVGGRGELMWKCPACAASVAAAPGDRARRRTPTPPRPAAYVIACAGCGDYLPHPSNRPAVRRCAGCARAHRAAQRATRWRQAELDTTSSWPIL